MKSIDYIKLIEKYEKKKDRSLKDEILYDLIYAGYTEEEAKKTYKQLKSFAKNP